MKQGKNSVKGKGDGRIINKCEKKKTKYWRKSEETQGREGSGSRAWFIRRAVRSKTEQRWRNENKSNWEKEKRKTNERKRERRNGGGRRER